MQPGATAQQAHQQPRIVICGAGIIGTAIAYYLAKRGQPCTVVDRCDVAAAASGRAGGFLALDWNDTSALGPFSRVSYALHEGLEEELGVSLDYRKLETFSVDAVEQGGLLHAVPSGYSDRVEKLRVQRLGTTSSTAQVHPRKLTEAFMARAEALAGSTFQRAAIRGILMSHSDSAARPTVVELDDGESIEADVVIVAMGPWSQLAAAWLPLPMAVSAQKYHSAVLKVDEAAAVSATALFTSVRRNTVSARQEPEIYPRPNGEVYVCGHPEAPPLPPCPSQVTVRDKTCAQIQDNCAVVASCLKNAPVVAQQACFLPLTPDGLPVMGQVPGVDGAYVATGHSCWGILNAPATGLAMSELILDGKASSVDLAPFSPLRFL